MNEFDSQQTQALERRLARLVDGELTGDEYRALLKALEDEPEGWRRCALAFLESQALARDLGALGHFLELPLEVPNAHKPAAQAREMRPAHQTPSVTNQRPTRRFPFHGLHVLAIAASFVTALSLGIVAPRFFSPRLQEPSVAGNFQQPDARHEVLRPLGGVRLVMDGSDGQPIEAGHVPVYDATGNLDELLTSQQAEMAPELIELFRRHGFEIQHQPQFVPAPLEDGRQLIVPVDGYQITPVGRRY
jgi:hypothetical protein